MRVAILDDIHRAYEGTTGVRRLRERAEVRIFDGPFGEPAALRGFDAEPLPPGHVLTKLPNVVLTPHLGWPTDQACEQFAGAAADVLLAYLDGRDVPRFEERH